MAFYEDDRRNLLVLLTNFDIPQDRKNDLVWISRNLFIKNRNHPSFNEAMTLIRRAINNDYVDIRFRVLKTK